MTSKKAKNVQNISYEKALRYAIFLGWIGVDRFYIGDMGRGILKAFTLSFYGIFWIVDILVIRDHKDDWDEWINAKWAKRMEAEEAKRLHEERAANGQCPKCKSTKLAAVSETTNKQSMTGALFQLSDLSKFVPNDTIVSVTKRVCLKCGYTFK